MNFKYLNKCITLSKVTNELINDDYRWDREAAASHKNKTNDEISMVIKNLEKDSKDRYLLNQIFSSFNLKHKVWK